MAAMSGLAITLCEVCEQVEVELDRRLPRPEQPGLDEALVQLRAALRYAVLGGGKRFRSYLVVAAADLYEVPRSRSLAVAAAVECLHAYSLVHDDLPAIDDDDVRRGKPSLHRAFDDATAILAGDALQSLAFEILAAKPTHPDAERRAALVLGLAEAAGMCGMVGGQMMDLHPRTEVSTIRAMQQAKTGALIRYCCRAGAILGGADDEAIRLLDEYGALLGLAYQIRDDLIDRIGDPGLAGKRLGKDHAAGKRTLLDDLGEDGAEEMARRLLIDASAKLQAFGDRAGALLEGTSFVLERDR